MIIEGQEVVLRQYYRDNPGSVVSEDGFVSRVKRTAEAKGGVSMDELRKLLFNKDFKTPERRLEHVPGCWGIRPFTETCRTAGRYRS